MLRLRRPLTLCRRLMMGGRRGRACSPYASQADEARERASVPEAARSHVAALRAWTVWLQFEPCWHEAREPVSVPEVARLHVESLRVWAPWIQTWPYLHEARQRSWLPGVAHSRVRWSRAWMTMTMTWMRS
jgi:hypothetical protein